MTKDQWCDIISVLYVLEEPVWLPWRRVLLGEEEIFHLEDLLFLCRNLSGLPSGSAEGGVNSRIVPV